MAPLCYMFYEKLFSTPSKLSHVENCTWGRLAVSRHWQALVLATGQLVPRPTQKIGEKAGLVSTILWMHLISNSYDIMQMCVKQWSIYVFRRGLCIVISDMHELHDITKQAAIEAHSERWNQFRNTYTVHLFWMDFTHWICTSKWVPLCPIN